MPHIRNTIESDLVEIQKLYTHYVVNTFSTFEINPPDQNELTRRWKTITSTGFPYLTAELENKIVGYTYASKYRSRSAYEYTIEDSVYVSPDFLGQGVGESLLNTLIHKCLPLGWRQMVAVIGDSQNTSSISLHEKCGFYKIGIMPSTGYKLGQWIDTIIMQRELGDGDKTTPLLK